MKTYKLSFISKKWGAIANEFVIKGKDESEAVINFTSKLNPENQLALSLYEIKAEQLIKPTLGGSQIKISNMKPKIIICDTNKELIAAIKKAKISSDHVDIEIVCGDIIKLHEKIPGSRIVTASNPEFSPDGGLDYVLAKKYTWSNPREFELTKDLFFVKTVDSSRKADTSIIFRALAGLFLHKHHGTFLLPVLGGGIGGFAIVSFIALLQRVLSYANLSYANLSYANLSSANLNYANLSSANLSYASLNYANLNYANLSSANLSYASLNYANLNYANLSSANLSYANLSYANLNYANLSSANLSSANLSYAKNTLTVSYNEGTAFFALSCPEEGTFIAWKKARGGTIIKLEIPAKAKRSSATTRKCRASQAKVLAIFCEKEEVKKAQSLNDLEFTYEVGKTVKPTKEFDEDRWAECSTGIHFFITREEAENYN